MKSDINFLTTIVIYKEPPKKNTLNTNNNHRHFLDTCNMLILSTIKLSLTCYRTSNRSENSTIAWTLRQNPCSKISYNVQRRSDSFHVIPIEFTLSYSRSAAATRSTITLHSHLPVYFLSLVGRTPGLDLLCSLPLANCFLHFLSLSLLFWTYASRTKDIIRRRW